MSVCEQDYAKTNQWILMKLGGEIGSKCDKDQLIKLKLVTIGAGWSGHINWVLKHIKHDVAD